MAQEMNRKTLPDFKSASRAASDAPRGSARRRATPRRRSRSRRFSALEIVHSTKSRPSVVLPTLCVSTFSDCASSATK
jgi:hypothetical protein